MKEDELKALEAEADGLNDEIWRLETEIASLQLKLRAVGNQIGVLIAPFAVGDVLTCQATKGWGIKQQTVTKRARVVRITGTRYKSYHGENFCNVYAIDLVNLRKNHKAGAVVRFDKSDNWTKEPTP